MELLLKRKYSFDSAVPPMRRRVEELEGGEELINALLKAVEGGEKILIYGDYDADGIMASYILYSGLDRLSPGRVGFYINDRFEDGYNITPDSIDKCLDMHPGTGLIITCDNGINAAEAVDRAMERGVKVLVTDHHVQTIPLREDCPAVDEKSIRQREADARAGVTPEEFCGAELARRVIVSLYMAAGAHMKERAVLNDHIAYAAFATITDHVPMNPSNHLVGRKGLRDIIDGRGFWGILKEEYFGIPSAETRERKLHWDAIGFCYGPMINAGGRITGTADPAMRMLISYYEGDEDACRKAVRELISLNRERRALCDHDDMIAFEIIEREGMYKDPFILLCDDRFSEGVNGLTATHICERYNVPSAVLSPSKNDPDRFKGSARSVEGCDLISLLTGLGPIVKAGGHAMAAGLSVEKKDIDELRRLLNEAQKGFVPPPPPEPDFLYEAADLDMRTVELHEKLIDDLEPFGPGFEEPCLHFKGTPRDLWEKSGRDSDENVHAVFPMGRSADGYFVQANWWYHLDEARRVYERGRPMLCQGTLSKNEYNGNVKIQITIDKVIEEK